MLLFNNIANISLGIQFYFEKNKKYQNFWKTKVILKLYIQTYIPRSIIKVLLLKHKN